MRKSRHHKTCKCIVTILRVFGLCRNNNNVLPPYVSHLYPLDYYDVLHHHTSSLSFPRLIEMKEAKKIPDVSWYNNTVSVYELEGQQQQQQQRHRHGFEIAEHVCETGESRCV